MLHDTKKLEQRLYNQHIAAQNEMNNSAAAIK